MQDKILVGNVQRFSIHDGPGIRTTVFLMGCPLRCPWCANPENTVYSPILRFYENRCIAKFGNCFLRGNCPVLNVNDSKIDLQPQDAEKCAAGAIAVYGKYYSAAELFQIVMRDRSYFCQGGGITFSGGEPLAQAASLVPFSQLLKNEGINLCVESCLNVSSENLKRLLPFIDEWFVDLKIASKEEFKDILGGDLRTYRDNLKILLSNASNVTLRIPIVPGITDTSSNLEAIYGLLNEIPYVEIELFSVHNLAESKYKELGLDFHYFSPAPTTKLEQIKGRLSKTGHNIHIRTL